ncbi:hypothetical protein AMAG_10611 [Allomyces macrogynus ATCC 38327]|uniref:Uncharacterized protein n=1 Tax=Allomyces macrogynus (strain ATCC 38327) TaxID=578462 RepID=A0A0L0SR14_ALLM3|nr:hypothetical protein AMAG_10611 [Allomyces macrogynus ATCC 38327]|eukprot:KNE64946.1 hypothetical protein AMAG_10611 [Allomyces macrogynus ATCC 38327]
MTRQNKQLLQTRRDEQDEPVAVPQVEGASTRASTRANTNADTDLSRPTRLGTCRTAPAHQDASRAAGSPPATTGSRSSGGSGGRSSCAPPIAAFGSWQPPLISTTLEADYMNDKIAELVTTSTGPITITAHSKLDTLVMSVAPAAPIVMAQVDDLPCPALERPVAVGKPAVAFADMEWVPEIVTASTRPALAGPGSVASRAPPPPPPPKEQQPAGQDMASMLIFAERGHVSLTPVADVGEPFWHYPVGSGVWPANVPPGAVILDILNENETDFPELDAPEETLAAPQEDPAVLPE